MTDSGFELRVRCLRGLEWVCADEVSSTVSLVTDLVMANRELTFRVPSLTSALANLRTADDVFLSVVDVSEMGYDRTAPLALAKRLAHVDWIKLCTTVAMSRPLPAHPAVDVVASVEGKNRFNRFDVEHAVGAIVADGLDGKYLARSAERGPVGDPDLTVRVFVRDQRVFVAVRLTRRPLHRRAYKQETGRGTLHPPLAAALSRLLGPRTGQTLADPFCGDGTIAIEASQSFPGVDIVASDLDSVRLAHAVGNAQRAGADVSFRLLDAGSRAWSEGGIDAVATNPPWNITVNGAGRLRTSLTPFWRQLEHALTGAVGFCAVTDDSLDTAESLRRRNFNLTLSSRVRLGGRLSQVIMGAPPHQTAPELPANLSLWLARAQAAGVVTEDGF